MFCLWSIKFISKRPLEQLNIKSNFSKAVVPLLYIGQKPVMCFFLAMRSAAAGMSTSHFDVYFDECCFRYLLLILASRPHRFARREFASQLSMGRLWSLSVAISDYQYFFQNLFLFRYLPSTVVSYSLVLASSAERYVKSNFDLWMITDFKNRYTNKNFTSKMFLKTDVCTIFSEIFNGVNSLSKMHEPIPISTKR